MVDSKDLEERYEVAVYPKRNITLVRGLGAKVWDDHGNEYIDCTAGVGVANAGHCNPEIGSAIKKQLDTLITCYSIFPNDQRALYLQELLSAAPQNLRRVFLCNSGTESIEAAIKFSRATMKKREIIALMRAFHGKTLGSLGAMWNEEYKEPFLLKDDDFKHVPANNIEKLREVISEKTAAVIMELVQGEGGVRALDKQYVCDAAKLCKEKDIFLIVDEVQTGFCRTGAMFCCEHYALQPDILCCAKGIANGIPMGACLVTERIQVPKKSHTTTFGGNPLACAGARATLKFLNEHNIAKHTQELGAYAVSHLQKLSSPKIREVRGVGLMIGIELKEKAAPYIDALAQKGILVLLAGPTVLRLLPPLVITKKEIDQVLHALKEVLFA